MAKLDAGEITLEELTPEDRQTIIDIRMQSVCLNQTLQEKLGEARESMYIHV